MGFPSMHTLSCTFLSPVCNEKGWSALLRGNMSVGSYWGGSLHTLSHSDGSTHSYRLLRSGWIGSSGLSSSCPLGLVEGAWSRGWGGQGPCCRIQSWCWCSSWAELGACPRPPHYQTSSARLQPAAPAQKHTNHRGGRVSGGEISQSQATRSFAHTAYCTADVL